MPIGRAFEPLVDQKIWRVCIRKQGRDEDQFAILLASSSAGFGSQSWPSTKSHFHQLDRPCEHFKFIYTTLRSRSVVPSGRVMKTTRRNLIWGRQSFVELTRACGAGVMRPQFFPCAQDRCPIPG